ncbi:MAG: hypothetical protein MZV70_62645 [Desulfobacterales bacterium]|nr:hypothetical protein [Desulfobacterales bacterium]
MLFRPRSRAGLERASPRRRSSVCATTQTSRATSSNVALSGGNSLVTTRSSNACP